MPLKILHNHNQNIIINYVEIIRLKKLLCKLKINTFLKKIVRQLVIN